MRNSFPQTEVGSTNQKGKAKTGKGEGEERRGRGEGRGKRGAEKLRKVGGFERGPIHSQPHGCSQIK